MTFRVAVADDEKLAREMVAALVRQDPDVVQVTECRDGRRLLDVVSRDRPDIVFLDIEMPGVNGLQIASALRPADVVVVFVTAFGQYAAPAFDVAAIDYLLKPFSDARFQDALQRAKRRVRDRRLGELASQTAALVGVPAATPLAPMDGRFLQQIPVKERDTTVMLRVADVVWIKAEDYYVLVHATLGTEHLIRTSLASLEERLDPAGFVRVHRTALVI